MNRILYPNPPLLVAYTPGASPAAPFYTLHFVESDTSRLDLVPGVGTVLDKSLAREWEFQIIERDANGYVGHCASFTGDRHAVALQQLLELAGHDLTNLQQNTKPKVA